MVRSTSVRPPYRHRSDLDKIRSNWIKVRGLIQQRQWSGAIVRAATATEIAANLAVRRELVDIRNLDEDFVDHLLKWANGVQGKFDKILIPVMKGDEWLPDFKRLRARAADINRERNTVVHSGSFKKRSTAAKVVKEAREIIHSLIEPYHDNIDLPPLDFD